ncbi:rod shape-determining protein MreC [Planotetraspora sp. GP83]|uniref:rod shape-determining protein MreC n=1 Tax=Planotetraspora sp. GP83 TaxID=3156264 RepID=UPI003514B197
MRDTRRTRLTLGILIGTALILITVDHRAAHGSLLAPVRDVASTVFGKFEGATSAVTAPIAGFFKTLHDAPGAERVITDLRKENASLKAELSAQRLDKARVAKLDRMLGLAGLGRYRVVPAQVVARRATPGFEDAVEIDAGSNDGVRADMTVLSGEGLVGRVVYAGPSTSTVVLLTDPALSAGARLEGGNELGVVSGLGQAGGSDNLIRFRLLDDAVPVAVGRRIVSFGSQRSAPYVAGVPIGVIERVENTPGELTRIAYARPFADFSSIDVVGVVTQAPKRDPRDSVLPPVPQPAKPPAPRPAKPSTEVWPPVEARPLGPDRRAGRGAGRERESARSEHEPEPEASPAVARTAPPANPQRRAREHPPVAAHEHPLANARQNAPADTRKNARQSAAADARKKALADARGDTADGKHRRQDRRA